MTDKIRESVIFYLKMDFGIFAATGALFTLLKLETNKIAQTLYDFSVPIQFIAILIVFALVMERLVVIPSDFETERAKNSYFRLVKVLLVIQTMAHIVLFAWLSGFTYAYIDSYVTTEAQIKDYEEVRGLVSNYLNKFGRIPKSQYELEKEYSSLSDVNSPNRPIFQYQYQSDHNYQITLPGVDKTLGTTDDLRREVVIALHQR